MLCNFCAVKEKSMSSDRHLAAARTHPYRRSQPSAQFTQLQSYYRNRRRNLEQEKREREELQRQKDRLYRENIERGVVKIFDVIPQNEALISFMQDAIDANVTSLELCDVCDEQCSTYELILEKACSYIEKRIPFPSRVRAVYRETGTSYVYSRSLIWDWSVAFPALGSPEGVDQERQGDRPLHAFTTTAPARNLMQKYNMRTLDKSDLEMFVE